MNDTIPLGFADYLTFFGYFVALSVIGYLAGRKSKDDSAGYFLAGRSLPWYVVGSSYIAANISSEHFIGMIGAAMIYGICVATPEWSSVIAFSFLIWIFIPFLLSANVFTAPEFLEKRFNASMRFFFALVTVIANVVAFLAPVIYGGGLALERVIGLNGILGLDTTAIMVGEQTNWGLYLGIAIIGLAAGVWAIWGGLKSVAWMDVLTIGIMVTGGLTVTVLGLYHLAGDGGSLFDGFRVMVERNRGDGAAWAEAIARLQPQITPGETDYNRLSVIQPLVHETTPWTHWVLSFFYIGLWYTVINQFMIQRVLAAKNMYHARMGITFAGYLKLLLPFIVVVPGLIYFAMRPELILDAPTLDAVRPEADKTYVNLIRELVPMGVKGLLLAALFGAIQSTVSAVLNATSTVLTLDFYKRYFRPDVTEHDTVVLGRWITTGLLIFSVLFGIWISTLQASLFVYIQVLFTFFAPPFSAVFLLGTLWRRINGPAATTTVLAGFVLGIAVKAWVGSGGAPEWLAPYANQGVLNWAFCMICCTVVSLLTAPPRPEQVTDDLTFNWRKMNIGGDLGRGWKNVTLWWSGSVVLMIAFIFIFGVLL